MGRKSVRAKGAWGGGSSASLQRACAALTGCVLAASIGTVGPRPGHVRAEDAAEAVPAQPVSTQAPPRENKLLTRMLQEGQSFQVRAGAAAVMGQRRDQHGRPELEGALGDSHPTVRAAAANALGRIGSTESLPPLREVTHDRVREVATTAQNAIQTIQTHAPSDSPVRPEPVATVKPRFGLMLGNMVNQSAFVRPEVSQALGVALQRQLRGVPGVVVFESDLQAAAGSGLTVFRLDGAVTNLSSVTTEDGHLSMHCEVALLVVDRPTGSLRTLFKGAARAVEVPKGDLDEQRLDIAQRVVAGAVRSALRNADSALAVAMR
jgi:hypothetical protein